MQPQTQYATIDVLVMVTAHNRYHLSSLWYDCQALTLYLPKVVLLNGDKIFHDKLILSKEYFHVGNRL
jgi:hypothetical protein